MSESVTLPSILEANLWKLKFDASGEPVPTKRWVYADSERIMYWKSETKPKHISKIPPKKVFKLQNCAISVNIIPPLKVPRPMMFQVFDKVENDSMIFAANTPDEYALWMAFLKVYCILRPPLLGMEANMWKIKFSPDGVAVPTRRWVYVDDEKIMYWRAHPSKHDDNKPLYMSASAVKKVFLLQHCVVSTTIVPPMNPPRHNMFQVTDHVHNESMVFAAMDDDQFAIWMKLLRKYCRYGKAALPREVEPEPVVKEELPLVAMDDIITDFFFQHAESVLPEPTNPRVSQASLSELLQIIAPHMGDSAVQLIFICLMKDAKLEETISYTEFQVWWAEYTRLITADPNEHDAPLTLFSGSSAGTVGSVQRGASSSTLRSVNTRSENSEILPSTKVDLLFVTDPDAVTLPKLCPLRSRTQPLEGGSLCIWNTNIHQRLSLGQRQGVSPYALVGLKQPLLPAVQRQWNIVCNLPSFVDIGTRFGGSEKASMKSRSVTDSDAYSKSEACTNAEAELRMEPGAHAVKWNDIYQTLLERVYESTDAIPVGQTEEETVSAVSLLRNFDLAAFKGKFHACALQGVITIISELGLPRAQKTIMPLSANPNEEPNYDGEEEQAHIDEAHAHASYFHNSLIFRIVTAEVQVQVDDSGTPLSADFDKQQALTIHDDILHKTAGQEFRASHSLQSATAAIRYHDMVKSTGRPLTTAMPWLGGPSASLDGVPSPGVSKPRSGSATSSVSVDPDSVLQHTAKSHAWFERKQKECTRTHASAESTSLPCPSLMLSALVDYSGFRVEVVAPVDLSRSLLAYGFNLKEKERAFSFVSTIRNINPWITEVGALLGVQPCSVGELRGVKHKESSVKAHPLDSALFLSKSMHIHRCPDDKRIYCTSMHDLLPNDFPRDRTTDVLTRFIRPEFSASAGAEAGGLAAGAFRHYEDSPLWDVSAAVGCRNITGGRFQNTVNTCKQVYTERLPTLAEKLDKLEYIPLDSYQLTELLHQYGCNCRLLGQLFELVSSPHCKYLIMSEIVARGCKSVINNALRMIKRQKTGFSSSAFCSPMATSSVTQTLFGQQQVDCGFDGGDDSLAQSYVEFFNLVLGGTNAGYALWTGVIADAVHKHFDLTLHFEDGAAPFIQLRQLFVAMQYHCGVTFSDDCIAIFANSRRPNDQDCDNGPLNLCDLEIITPIVKISSSLHCPDAVGLIQRVTELGDSYALVGMYKDALNAYRIRLSLLHLAYPAENSPFNGEIQTILGDNNIGSQAHASTGGFVVGNNHTNELRCPKLQAIFDEVSYKIIHCQYQLGDYELVLTACRKELSEKRVQRQNTRSKFARKPQSSGTDDVTVINDGSADIGSQIGELAYTHSLHCMRLLTLLMCAEFKLHNARKSMQMYEAASAICTDLLGEDHPLHAVLASTLSDLYRSVGSEAMQHSLIMKLHAQRVIRRAMGSQSLVLASITSDVGDLYQLAHIDSLDSRQHALAAYTTALTMHAAHLDRYKIRENVEAEGNSMYETESEDCKMHMVAVVKCSFKLSVLLADGRGSSNDHRLAFTHAMSALVLIDSFLAAVEQSFGESSNSICSEPTVIALSEARYEVREAFNLRHLKIDFLALIGACHAAQGRYPEAIEAYAEAHYLVQTELRGEHYTGALILPPAPGLSEVLSVLIKSTLSAVHASFSSQDRQLLQTHVDEVNKYRAAVRIEFIEAYNCAVEFLIQFLWEIDNPALYFQVLMEKIAKFRASKPAGNGASIDLNGLKADERFFESTSTVILDSCDPDAIALDVTERIFASSVLQSTVIVNLIGGAEKR